MQSVTIERIACAMGRPQAEFRRVGALIMWQCPHGYSHLAWTPETEEVEEILRTFEICDGCCEQFRNTWRSLSATYTTCPRERKKHADLSGHQLRSEATDPEVSSSHSCQVHREPTYERRG